jgi:cytochrome c peroxidase
MTVSSRTPAIGIASLVVFGALATGCSSDPDSDFPSDDELVAITGLRKVRTLPRVPSNRYADDADAAMFGQRVFAETRFSPCGLACIDCHQPPTYAAAVQRALACGGNLTRRNPKSLLNVGFDDWLYWDGRKDSLWAHPEFPLLNPLEMQSTPAIIRAVFESADYSGSYQQVFGVRPADEPDDYRLIANLGKSVEAYLRRVTVRVDAPFDDDLDRFVAAARGGNAKSDPMWRGLLVFVRKGRCIACHKGPLLTDGAFHNLGVREDVAEDHGRREGIQYLRDDPLKQTSIYSDERTLGRAKLEAALALPDSETDGTFRTPTLRNLTLTAPYLHTGALRLLEDVIEFYARGGDPEGTFSGRRAESIRPFALSADEKKALLDLLTSLTAPER